jgi:predicted transcriptional regulator of viral defense system
MPNTVPKGRVQLVEVLHASGDVIRIGDVVKTLTVTRAEAARRLSRWTEQGWLRRVGRGAYISVSLDALGAEQVLDDPWILVPALFAPAYIAGRTAAEHWDLTEQLFKDIVVLTAQPLRQTRQLRHGAEFTLRHMAEAKHFGTKAVWRQRSKVLVSDIHRTIVDILDDPEIGGGIQHVSECLTRYLAHRDRDDNRLIQYADRLGNGAVFKRLGFLAERIGRAEALVNASLSRLTAGNAKLDVRLDCRRTIARWHLQVPENWVKAVSND